MESKRNRMIREQIIALILLIEPVWNRNPIIPYDPETLTEAFNRTSMESKPVQDCQLHRLHTLLIEPVWNRNYLQIHQRG